MQLENGPRPIRPRRDLQIAPSTKKPALFTAPCGPSHLTPWCVFLELHLSLISSSKCCSCGRGLRHSYNRVRFSVSGRLNRRPMHAVEHGQYVAQGTCSDLSLYELCLSEKEPQARALAPVLLTGATAWPPTHVTAALIAVL